MAPLHVYTGWKTAVLSMFYFCKESFYSAEKQFEKMSQKGFPDLLSDNLFDLWLPLLTTKPAWAHPEVLSTPAPSCTVHPEPNSSGIWELETLNYKFFKSQIVEHNLKTHGITHTAFNSIG